MLELVWLTVLFCFVLWLGISRHSACLAAPPYCAPSVILRGAKRSRRICWWVFARWWLAGWYTPSGYAGSACGQTAKCRSGCSNRPEVALCEGRLWPACGGLLSCVGIGLLLCCCFSLRHGFGSRFGGSRRFNRLLRGYRIGLLPQSGARSGQEVPGGSGQNCGNQWQHPT